jgi:galactose mutarotase-like enzyme
MGVVPPADGFLTGLRDRCTVHGIVLIFDEVISGFRAAPGGAQAVYGVRPDLTCLGKIIGGGLPVGAYGGRADIMGLVAPAGPVYQAGTLSGNPLAMTAGLWALDRLKPRLYSTLAARGRQLASGLAQAARAAKVPLQVNAFGSLLTPFFVDGPVRDYDSALRADTEAYGRFFRGMLARGVYPPPSQFEAWFISAAHTDRDIVRTTAAAPARAQRYSAVQQGEIVTLADRTADTVVTIVPSVGNMAIEMKVKGHNVLRYPQGSVAEFKARPGTTGIPFMGPWANRLDEQAFYANGRRHAFDMTLGNVRGEVPIHGFVTTTNLWHVTAVTATAGAASVTSRLEFYRQPAWIRQWPYAHAIDMTYRLADGVLEVATVITNLSDEPMPVAIGFHPYFQLTDSMRDDWTISVGAKSHWLLDANHLPTGETQPIESFFPDPKVIPLKDYDLDHVFGDLARDGSGRAVMTLKGKAQELDVVLGPNYRAMVIYAPKPKPGTGAGAGQGAGDRNYICFEPMVGITNALNLAHKGLYKDLQSVPPGGIWEESFWVRVRGF